MPVPTLITSQRGFSLIELIAVIVLLGIVLVTIAPRFTSQQSFAEFAVRDQLISSFRYAQQRAMYDHSGNCYSLLIDTDGFGPQRNNGSAIEYIGPMGQITFSGDYSQLSVTVQTLYFDGLGNVLTDSCSSGMLGSRLTITVFNAGAATIALDIFPSGYVRAI